MSTLAANSSECPYQWSVTVVDNGSTDETWGHRRVVGVRGHPDPSHTTPPRGRGRALKEAWSTSTADVVAYMDVDLSTGLESLRGLIDPLVAGS